MNVECHGRGKTPTRERSPMQGSASPCTAAGWHAGVKWGPVSLCDPGLVTPLLRASLLVRWGITTYLPGHRKCDALGHGWTRLRRLGVYLSMQGLCCWGPLLLPGGRSPDLDLDLYLSLVL